MAGIFGLLMSGAGVIKDQYYNLTSLLLPGNGTNGAQNNTFLDSGTANSGSGFTITRNGNTTQGTFSPFSQTGWGNYFNGSSYISTTGFNFSTSDFTIECFINSSSVAAGPQPIGGYASSGLNYTVALTSGGVYQFYLSSNGSTWDIASGVVLGTATAGKWHHIVIVRSGNSIRGYFDGTGGTTITSSAAIYNNSTAFYIGAAGSAGGNLTGYFSNVRVLLGTAAYNPASSTITVPTAPFATGTTNQVLLTCQANRFIDSNTATTAKTITVSGSAQVTPFSPFAPTQSYSAAAVGGSGYFDGTGDYVQAASNAAFAIGTGDFAIECFVYFTGTAQGGGTSGELFGSTTTGSIVLRYKSGTLALSRVNTADDMSASVTLTPNQWYHICATRTGTTGALYLNGARVGTASSYTASYAQGDIGTINNTQGYLTCCRLIKAANPYGTDTTITVPTAPLTAVSGTSLLLNFTNAGVVDATAKNVLETVGNAQISTGAGGGKWGGGSMRFPQSGTNDYLYKPYDVLLNRLSGNFTMECWIYPTAAGTQMIFAGSLSAAGSDNWLWEITSANKLSFTFSIGGSSVTATSTASISQNTWTYVAVVRNGGTLTQYINGSSDGTASPTAGAYRNASFGFAIGRGGDYNASYYTGYIDDFRITIGQARTITASPTAPFPVQ